MRRLESLSDIDIQSSSEFVCQLVVREVGRLWPGDHEHIFLWNQFPPIAAKKLTYKTLHSIPNDGTAGPPAGRDTDARLTLRAQTGDHDEGATCPTPTVSL